MKNYRKSIKIITFLLSVSIVIGAYTSIKYRTTSDQSKVEKLKLQPGFKAEHLFSPSENDMGSWVSMCFDDKDRMIVSDQYGGLYRLQIPAITATNKEPIVEPLTIKGDTINIGTAHGLLYAFNSLYVMVNHWGNENFPRKSGFYRLQDTDGDDEYDKITLLQELVGAGEHGPHSIRLSPDGESLYVLLGNHTDMPELDAYRLPKTWAYDNLFPEIKDPRGHANSRSEPGGWLAKVDPEGEHWELISAGYRNAFDLAFNDIGDLFVYDADMEWDFGTPWYRPTRINHATSGSEYGWRTGDGKWPAYFADNLPAIVNIGQGSPTNLLYLKDANFPLKYKQSLLAFDWSFGIMHAIHLKPEGSSYSAEREEFLSGVPLPLTDGVIGPDGNLYFLTGGRNLQSDLYRVSYDGAIVAMVPPMTVQTDENKLRRSLEQFHMGSNNNAITAAWPELNNSDRFIRYAARIAVEHQPVDEWRSKALNEKDAVSLTNALIALTRNGTPDLKEPIYTALLGIDLPSLSESQQLDVLRAYELTITRMGLPTEISKNRIVAVLDPMFPAAGNDKNQALGKLLITLEAPGIIEKTMKLLEKEDKAGEIAGGQTATTSADLIMRNPQYGLDIARMLEKVPPVQQTFFAMMLSQAKEGWTAELREKYFLWYKKAFSYKGGNSYIGFLDKARQMALDKVPEDKKEYYDELSGGGMLTSNGNSIALDEYPKGPRRNWELEEAQALFKEPLANRNYSQGKAMYNAITCGSCHSMQGEGGSIGPDLTQLGTRFTTNDMLEAIIEPSNTISDQYAAMQIQMKDGSSLVARIINEDDEKYEVSQNPYAPNILIELAKTDVISVRQSDISVMMPNMINSLNEEELKDLIAYIMSGGDGENELFKSND